jgi:hypothetical protein
MINKARSTHCLGQTARILHMYVRLPHITRCPYLNACGTQKLDTTSVQLKSENFVESPCKRHHRSTLVFSPTCFASRRSGVQIPSRPPKSFRNLRCNFSPRFRVGYFWSIWSNYGLRQLEAISCSLGLFEAHFEFLVEKRV